MQKVFYFLLYEIEENSPSKTDTLSVASEHDSKIF